MPQRGRASLQCGIFRSEPFNVLGDFLMTSLCTFDALAYEISYRRKPSQQ